jgi:LmbE family N-acetylglucosaminyl deacetylase
MTRKQFLLSLGASSVAEGRAQPRSGSPKVLLVVAHPDDEYFFAATVYRIAKELRGTVDQVVITNGEAGYRYSTLAEQFYSANLTNEGTGRARLPEIRRRETLAAGKVLGIRQHHFLNRRDAKFTLDPADAFNQWGTEQITHWIAGLMDRERYDYLFTILPTPDTHGHHQAATLIALAAAGRLPDDVRPVALGADPALASQPVRSFAALADHPETAPWPAAPVFRFNRLAHFGYNRSLTYQIVVNWMIAEHKSQGLFQTECNRLDEERFWLFERNPPDALEKTCALFERTRRDVS